MKIFNVKTAIATVCVVAASFGGVKAYNAAAQSETDMLLAENVEALSSGDWWGSWWGTDSPKYYTLYQESCIISRTPFTRYGVAYKCVETREESECNIPYSYCVEN